MFFKPCSDGSWFLFSISNPRWNMSGRSTCVGNLGMPSECEIALDSLKQKYGEQPKDLEWGYMKD